MVLVPRELGICLIIIATVLAITSNVRLAIAVGLTFLPLIIWQLNGSGMLVAFSLAIVLFLGIRALVDLLKAMRTTEGRGGLVFDRKYHFWQTRKK